MNRCTLFALSTLAAFVAVPSTVALAKTKPLTPLPLAAGVANYAAGHSPATFTRVGDTVHLRGMVKRTGAKWGAVIATLPTGFRPDLTLTFLVSSHTSPVRIDVKPNGEIRYVVGAAGGWISLAGITFSTGKATPLALGAGWSGIKGFAPPRFHREGTAVQLSGLARQGTASNVFIGTLPAGSRPRKRLIFNVSQHETGARVDVLSDGRVMLNLGKAKLGHRWVSLAGIRFDTASPTTLAPKPGWEVLGGDYEPPGVTVTDRVVRLTGAFKRTGSTTVVTTLPPGARPIYKQVIFLPQTHGGGTRLNIASTGDVTVTSAHAWVSLAGLEFAISPRIPVTSFVSSTWYKVRNAWQKTRCLDIRNDAHDRFVHLQPCAKRSGQQWRFTPIPQYPGHFRLTTAWQGAAKCLAVNNVDKGKIVLEACGKRSGQVWRIVEEPQLPGQYRVVNEWRGDDECLDVINDATDKELRMATCRRISGQIWHVEKH